MARLGTLDAIKQAFWAWVYVMSHRHAPPPWIPGRPSARLIATNPGKPMSLTYKLELPANTAPDVVSTTAYISVTPKGGEVEETVVPEATSETTFTVPDDAFVSIQISQVDDAGNESEKSEAYQFNAQDTLAPPRPGLPGAVLVGEA